ncbi:MAG: phosphate/phosphite/phosphonate ABC transporter substrate-binding protein [Spirochaetales bacterium]|jgi:phosphonate transport system substrate-binding protein|nr:phosphate/phosphite/phosphonate ABC transporter substrate-binding protein [Spirochaetales bacterium]
MKRTISILLLQVVISTLVFANGKQEPLGSEDNPIVWSFVPSSGSTEIAAGAKAVAQLIYDKTGLYVEINVATLYSGVIEALESDPPSAHMTSLATFAYVMAADRGVSEAALVSVRYGSPFYNGQIITTAGSGISKLEDLAGKSFARPDPLSTSGWIIPMLSMRAAGVDPDKDLKEVVDAGGHTAVVSAVYSGDVDAGATFVDARVNIEDDHADVMDKVVVMAVSPNIPNDGVQFHPSVPQETRDILVDALIEIIVTDAGQAAFKNAYKWNDLARYGDDFYDPFRQVLQAAGLKAEDLIEE